MALNASNKFSGKLESCGFKIVRANGRDNRTALTTWDDMIACDMPSAKVTNAYKKKFGLNPGKVHLNDEFCKTYGWLSYNLLGKVKYYNEPPVQKSSLSGERFLENKTSQPFTTEVQLSTTRTNSATATVTNASSVSVGSQITIGSEALGIDTQFSQHFTFSNEVGSSSTQSTEVTVSDKVTVTVPPGARFRVFLEVLWTQEDKEWEIPVKIDPYGLTGAQFPRRVDGHYYWAVSHNGFFSPPFQSKIQGKLQCAYNTSGRVVVEDWTRKEKINSELLKNVLAWKSIFVAI